MYCGAALGGAHLSDLGGHALIGLHAGMSAFDCLRLTSRYHMFSLYGATVCPVTAASSLTTISIDLSATLLMGRLHPSGVSMVTPEFSIFKFMRTTPDHSIKILSLTELSTCLMRVTLSVTMVIPRYDQPQARLSGWLTRRI